jgi:hypothetical protein
MSRFGDWDGDEDFQNQGYFWMKRAQLALEGKRGRKALVELREALMALPEPRLIEGAFCEPKRDGNRIVGGEVCAVGAYAWYKKVKAGMDPVEAFGSLPHIGDDEFYGGSIETARAGRDAGLTYTLAWELGDMNDETFAGLTPEERHAAFIRFIDKELARPPLRRPGPKPKREKRPRHVGGRGAQAEAPAIPLGL